MYLEYGAALPFNGGELIYVRIVENTHTPREWLTSSSDEQSLAEACSFLGNLVFRIFYIPWSYSW